jgi:hypothetical protein
VYPTAPATKAVLREGSDASVLCLNAALARPACTAAAVEVASYLESRGAFSSPVLIPCALRLPGSSGPLVFTTTPEAAVPPSLASVPRAPPQTPIHDPLAAALFHVLQSRGLPAAFLAVPGYRPSFKNAAEISLEAAAALGGWLEKALGGALRFDAARCGELAAGPLVKFYVESDRADNQLYT